MSIVRVQRMGAQLKLVDDKGVVSIAYPSNTRNEWIAGSADTPPTPGEGGWHHPLGDDWPRGTYTTYTGEPSHDAGAVDFGTGYGGQPPLYSACDGEVILAGRWGIDPGNGYGQSLTLVVKPDGESVGVTYLHMNRIDVSVGDRVTGGQQVGLAGWSGYTDPAGPGGAHLHLEVRENGTQWGPWRPAVSYFASKGITL